MTTTDPMSLLHLGEHTAVGIRTNVGQADALDLLYAAVIGERGELGRMVRGLLILHQVLPGTGNPWPDCAYCHGTGVPPAVDTPAAGEHCHCRCPICTCNEPVCGGPCDSLGVLLDALVLRGLPAEAIDVPRTLAMLHVAGARRIAERAVRRGRAIVDPVDDQPGTARITVGDQVAADRVEAALRAEGYRCEQQPVPGPFVTVRLTATRVF